MCYAWWKGCQQKVFEPSIIWIACTPYFCSELCQNFSQTLQKYFVNWNNVKGVFLINLTLWLLAPCQKISLTNFFLHFPFSISIWCHRCYLFKQQIASKLNSLHITLVKKTTFYNSGTYILSYLPSFFILIKMFELLPQTLKSIDT